ncbi:hypothetical protein CCHL11_00417 [Colletotrichum chlorophyti]|uniref:Zn(2)-C6 fungal-type domain-containing protein n=1 Tax=Colletotrichum chlorophyti TaxID=708187 RepID=A0A1Q8RUS4_9PEZI|nr:hypothetical protein CCHL11_00417 [Colletotrichum chlorophyti]
MSLGRQCWRCRKRRLRCDSCLPACTRCETAGIGCPGYSESKPIAWRNPVVLTRKGLVRVCQPENRRNRPKSALPSAAESICRPPRTASSELDLRIAADAMEYYNLHVALDLVPYSISQSPYQIPPQSVGELAPCLRHAFISIAALHRHIISQKPAMTFKHYRTVSRRVAWFSNRSYIPRRDSELSQLVSVGNFEGVYFATQAAALKALSEGLSRLQSGGPTSGPYSDILLGIVVLLSSQVQFSAYAPWQSHLQGAWGLVHFRGELGTTANKDQDLRGLSHHLAVIDIIGTSTQCLTKSSAEMVVSRHTTYASTLKETGVVISDPWLLVPNDMALALIQINIFRAQNVTRSVTRSSGERLPDILDSVEASEPDRWAAEAMAIAAAWLAPSQLSDDEETEAAWLALMTAYHSAITVYAISSIAGLGRTPTTYASSTTYNVNRLGLTAFGALLASLHVLFDQRERVQSSHNNNAQGPSKCTATSAGLLHKFAIWPMVIGGIQAALVYSDDETTDQLCSWMQAVGEELGTVSAIDGAYLVRELQRLRRNGRIFSSWDNLFDGAPLFLM